MLLARLVGAGMHKRGQGAIVNIGWDQAEHGMAGASGELFAATKGAVMAFTKSLARSLAPRGARQLRGARLDQDRLGARRLAVLAGAGRATNRCSAAGARPKTWPRPSPFWPRPPPVSSPGHILPVNGGLGRAKLSETLSIR